MIYETKGNRALKGSDIIEARGEVASLNVLFGMDRAGYEPREKSVTRNQALKGRKKGGLQNQRIAKATI